LLEKPLGVMPGRLFLLTWEGDMPNDKPLKPDDFPVEVEGEELVTADGKPIAKAKTPAIPEDIVTVSTKTTSAKSRTDGRLDVARGPRRSIPLTGRGSIIPAGVNRLASKSSVVLVDLTTKPSVVGFLSRTVHFGFWWSALP
jgi:hypothetical protein